MRGFVIAKLVALVLPLGLDTFAIVAALGMVGVSPARRLRISLLFTALEAAMPLIGLALGAPLGRAIGGAADYVAIGVLLAFGLHTLLASDQNEETGRPAHPRGAPWATEGLSGRLALHNASATGWPREHC